MSQINSDYVFLMDCADFSEAQVVRSYLLSQGFHPRVRDEQTRSVAPHFGQLLGRLTLEVPEAEFLSASQALEKFEKPPLAVAEEEQDAHSVALRMMGRRAVWNAILGMFILPIACNIYSLYLSFRVFRAEFPIASQNKRYLLWASIFNCLSIYFWLTIAPSLIRQIFQ